MPRRADKGGPRRGRRRVHPRGCHAGRSAGFLQLGALGGEADFGEAQEDEAEESLRTATIEVRFGKMGCRHCLLGGIPEAFFERGVVRVLFGWGDPDHGVGARVCRAERNAISNGSRRLRKLRRGKRFKSIQHAGQAEIGIDSRDRKRRVDGNELHAKAILTGLKTLS